MLISKSSLFPKRKDTNIFKLEPKEGAGLFWDPCGGWVDPQDYQADREEIDKDFKKYEENPSLPQRNFYLFCIPLMLFGVLSAWQYDYLSQTMLNSEGGIRVYGLIGFFCFAAPAMYRRLVHSLQRDYIKKLLADKHQWLYNPYGGPGHWESLRHKFPEIFDKGTKKQKLYDEFWGTITDDRKTTLFYSSIFEYTVVSGSGKNRREHTYYQTIFAFKLKKSLKADFLLHPENGLRWFRWFSRKEIDTESDEFNRAFAFTYNGAKDEKALEIVKTLSPAVQTKLLDLKKTEKYFSFLFKEEAVIFATNGHLLPKMHTNFFKKVAIDPKDEEALQKRMHGILEIVGDIVPYLS
ncbi:MAG TPA: hypothetical protein VIT68_02540 [Candidatus Gracilibacteria bacterium]